MNVEYLRNWGRHTHGSPLYAHLVEVTASSVDLMSVLTRIVNRPPPNLYFAAIEGDVLDVLGDVLADLPDGEPAIVMNSLALIQLDASDRNHPPPR